MCKEKMVFLGGRIEKISQLKSRYPKATFLSSCDVRKKAPKADHIFILWQWCDHKVTRRFVSKASAGSQIHYIEGSNMDRIIKQINAVLSA